MNSNWSYSPETKIWVVTSLTLTFDLWPWPFAWTLPWSNVITPENFMMIRWWEHSQKGVTDGQTDRQTDRRTENTIHRAAWSQLKINLNFTNILFLIFITESYYMQSNYGLSSSNFNSLTHICVSKLSILGSDNGLSPGRQQAII